LLFQDHKTFYVEEQRRTQQNDVKKTWKVINEIISTKTKKAK